MKNVVPLRGAVETPVVLNMMSTGEFQCRKQSQMDPSGVESLSTLAMSALGGASEHTCPTSRTGLMHGSPLHRQAKDQIPVSSLHHLYPS